MSINFSKYINSKSTHYISNSGKDENSGIKGGQAGDQTGHEWELKKWYSRPWTVVLRYPDQKVALKIAELSIAAALNDKIGYDQSQRNTYWTELKKAKYDPSAITTPCEEDCTAGVSANVRAAGYIFGITALQKVSICSSRNMRKEFTKAGFEALTDSKYLTSGNYLLPGDILLYESHHAAANVTIGSKVRNDWHPEEDAKPEPTPEPKPTPTPAPDPEPTTKEQYIHVTRGNYYIRTKADAKAKVITCIKKGGKVPYLGTIQNGWYKVKFEKKTGWMSTRAGKIVTVETKYLTVKSGNWNVRQSNTTNSKRLGSLKAGSKVKYLGTEKNGWYMVEYNGSPAWMSKRAF